MIGELKNTTDSKHPMIKNYIFSLLVQKPVLFDQYSEYLSELVAMTNDHAILSLLLRVYESKDDIIKQKAILSKLLLLQPKDSNSKVKLAKLYLKEGNISEAEDLLKGVENPEEIGDIAYLQFIEKNIHVSKKDDEVPIEQVVGQKDQKKKINKKKVRLPKNMDKFIDNFKGDPERWLPKWQRKGYKKKGKKGGKTQGLATVSK